MKGTRDDDQRIVTASFLGGAGPGGELPPPTTVEIAFAGRSNVGKSSLINALVERKNLVRVSSTPGSTRQLNLYEARARDKAVFHLVDLPGYGFTRRSKAEAASWKALIEGYLTTRATLAATVVIVDVRRGLEPDDRELVEFVESSTGKRPGGGRVEVIVVATKLDKLPRASRKTALDRVGKAAGRKVLGFSAETGEGKPALWAALRRATGLAAGGTVGDNATPTDLSSGPGAGDPS